jgi:predicted dehydrogenase
MSENLSRRSFVTRSTGAALATGPAVLRSLGANNQVNVGFIGTGSRGYYLMEMLYKGSPGAFQITAVCDTFTGRLARAKDRVETMGKNQPKTYANYHELLADPSVEAVVIATPEHLHQAMTLAAIKAKKHIYVEKPLAHTIEEGEAILKAAANYDRVIQVGTQNRSNKFYQKAKGLIADGLIGDVHYVRAFWYRNSLDTNPAWRYQIPPDATEQNSDWQRFLGTAPKRPFNKNRYYQWRLYWDYSGGISTDLLVHQTDITNFVCGKTVPASCMASGGVYRWGSATDDREVPDTISAIYEYPGKFHINYSCYFGNDHFGYGEQFMGTEGTIEVISRRELHFYPEKFQGKAPARISSRKEIHETDPGSDNESVMAHLRNWLEASQGKGKVIAPPAVGQQAAIGGHLATLSYRNGKKVIWNDTTRKYRFA